jgi:GntR family histidine utilization transcriptional repressor
MQENIPHYQALKRHIIEGINSQQWLEHSQVPSENKLCEQFGVSRMTANRALRELTEEGILYRIQGLGTFVNENKPIKSALQIRDIAKEVKSRGNSFHSEVHQQKEIIAPLQACHHLSLKSESHIFYSLVLHFENDQPIQLEERYINKESAPGYLDIDLGKVTANHYLKKILPLSGAQHIVEAIAADKMTAKYLQIKPQMPCILISRVTWSDNIPVTFSRLTHPGNRYRLET